MKSRLLYSGIIEIDIDSDNDADNKEDDCD